MRVYVMTDLEGAAGVANSTDWCLPSSRHYPLACRLLTDQVNAAVTGFLAAGATRVTVVDGHGHGGIDVGQLHPEAEYLRGPGDGPYPFFLDDGFDAMAWVGQHAMAGTPYAHLPHTGNFNIADYRINGVSVGEFAQIALCGALYGVRPFFGTGDAAFVAEARQLVPAFHGVAVKRGLSAGNGQGMTADAVRDAFAGAVHRPRGRVLTEIREGAEASLRALDSSGPTIPLPATWERSVTFRELGGSPDVVRRGEYPNLLALLNDLDDLA